MKKYISKKLVKFVSKIFELAGSNNEESYIVADHLVDSNLVGHDSHGVIRVPQYMEWFNKGNINLNQRPEELSIEMFYKITLQYEKLFN